MADFTVNSPRQRAIRADGWEYRLYFALLFAIALPFATVRCLRARLTGAASDLGPIARARAEANQIVPMIFRG
jgi:hypothetical protein